MAMSGMSLPAMHGHSLLSNTRVALPLSFLSLSSTKGSCSIIAIAPKRQRFRALAVSTGQADTTSGLNPAITLSENALTHLTKLKEDQKKDLLLRIGVRQGGCSGMSYIMDFEERTNIRSDDSIIEYEGFTMVCDPKSLLYLFGMQLDYSNALIGGGFSFKNPNATSTCGCGKSFAA